MTYANRETSVRDGRPVEAYELIGTFGAYRYTDADEEVVIGGRSFLPALIDRNDSDVSSITDALKAMNIFLPQDDKLTNDYGGILTPETLSVTIYRAHRGDDWSTDFKRIWGGIAYGYNFDGRYFTVMTCPLPQSILQGDATQVKYQLKCNHSLYDTRCRVPRSSNQSDTSVVSLASGIVTVGASAWADSDLVFGRIVSLTNGESRAILGNSGTTIQVDRDFMRMVPGDGVRLIRGCNKKFDRCEKGFDNTKQFGGFPYKPEEFGIIKVGIGELPGPKIEVLDKRLLVPDNLVSIG